MNTLYHAGIILYCKQEEDFEVDEEEEEVDSEGEEVDLEEEEVDLEEVNNIITMWNVWNSIIFLNG